MKFVIDTISMLISYRNVKFDNITGYKTISVLV